LFHPRAKQVIPVERARAFDCSMPGFRAFAKNFYRRPCSKSKVFAVCPSRVPSRDRDQFKKGCMLPWRKRVTQARLQKVPFPKRSKNQPSKSRSHRDRARQWCPPSHQWRRRSSSLRCQARSRCKPAKDQQHLQRGPGKRSRKARCRALPRHSRNRTHQRFCPRRPRFSKQQHHHNPLQRSPWRKYRNPI